MGRSEDEVYDRLDEIVRLESEGMKKPTTVGEYGAAWLPIAFPSVRDSTYRGLATHLQKLVDVIGTEKLNEITPTMVKRVYAEKYLGMSNSYIKAGKQLFCALFDSAAADGFLSFNPARDRTAKPHKGTEGSHRAITDQERWWIEHYCTDHRAHAAAMAMLYAGIRPQEAKALKIDESVDFENDVITLKDFAHLKDSNHYEITQTGKTDKAARKIPLFSPLKTALKGKKGYLVTSASGKMVTIKAWKSVWESYVTCMETAINGCQKRWYGKTKEHKAILAEGGKLPPWIEFTVVPYDLRHSFCTWGRDHGVELHTMIEWMGHADAKMIMKIYDEVRDERSKKEAEKLLKTAFGSGNGSE